MKGEVISLVAFLVLSIACVLIFLLATRRIFSTEQIVRRSLAQQLPLADVNYLLSTSSVDLNDVQSLVWLGERIRKIRSPVLPGPKIRNVEVWIIISLVLAEHRVFQAKMKTAILWIVIAGSVVSVANGMIVIWIIYNL
jgi:hypothetical protein